MGPSLISSKASGSETKGPPLPIFICLSDEGFHLIASGDKGREFHLWFCGGKEGRVGLEICLEKGLIVEVSDCCEVCGGRGRLEFGVPRKGYGVGFWKAIKKGGSQLKGVVGSRYVGARWRDGSLESLFLEIVP
ncbi:hypothetical protein CK203_079583 [Vitis vinifera]|uniref:Uncharacterized protein n=1 Tax=Vitis vinifera TaxID=29760 RepID=A0A438EWE2_VITVI|nr:hypothetical protein CK203_079583 [Vitis vinifera]